MHINRRKSKWLILVGVILAVAVVFRHFILSLFFAGSSHVLSPDLTYAKKEIWSYDKGFKIGEGDYVDFAEDWRNFDCTKQTFFLRNDTVFYKCVPKATVVRTNKRSGEMVIRSIGTKEEGSYSNNPDLHRL